MEKLSEDNLHQASEQDLQAKPSKGRNDERRTDNEILSILARNAERKHNGRQSKRPTGAETIPCEEKVLEA